MPRPKCGVNIPSGAPSSTTIVVGTVGTVFSVGGAIAGIKGIVWSAAPIIGIGITAGVAAAAVIATVIYFAIVRCDKNPAGEQGCMAGVIESLTPAFTGSAWDYVFPFSSAHDRVDVVVKQDYWDIIDAQSEYVFCSATDKSPMVPCFYYNPAVCNAGIGAAVGATVDAVLGTTLGILLAASIGCGPFAWLCALIALLVALSIAVCSAIIGAMSGGAIGRAATKQPIPMSSGNQLIPPQPLIEGDYVSERGNLLKSGDLMNALVFYFVKHTTLHGRSLKSPSYSHTDPDHNLVPDACQPPTPSPPPPPII